MQDRVVSSHNYEPSDLAPVTRQHWYMGVEECGIWQ